MADSHDLFTVNGTRFAFPKLPEPLEDYGPAAYKMRDRRDRLLAEARTTRFVKPREVRPLPCPKPGIGDFAPKPGAPGAAIELDDGTVGEVWALAPKGRRWVVRGGEYVEITPSGRVLMTHTGEGQRQAIVAELQRRYINAVMRQVMPVTPPMPWRTDEMAAWLAATEPARRWACAYLANKLYPAVYPHPGDFELKEAS
jgi:hypothetical protein